MSFFTNNVVIRLQQLAFNILFVMTCRQQLSTCQEAVLISKYVYSRPTYLYTNIQTFDNVWLKWLKTTVPRDNSERNNTAARVQHCIQQGKAAVNF